MKAVWEGTVVAESDQTEIVEGNHYFPPAALKEDLFKPSDYTTHCGWKGTANYKTIVVDGKENANAAWYYPDPKPAAKNITGFYAFWKGVKVE